MTGSRSNVQGTGVKVKLQRLQLMLASPKLFRKLEATLEITPLSICLEPLQEGKPFLSSRT